MLEESCHPELPSQCFLSSNECGLEKEENRASPRAAPFMEAEQNRSLRCKGSLPWAAGRFSRAELLSRDFQALTIRQGGISKSKL